MKKTQKTQKTQKKVIIPKRCKDIFKPIILGPFLTTLIFAILYIAWWGLAKMFYLLHGFMAGTVWPWVQEAWPYALAIWGFILVAAGVYNLLFKENTVKKETVDPFEVTIEDSTEASFDAEFDGEI